MLTTDHGPPPTDEQQHVLNLLCTTEKNILVNSLAGTGKTTMHRMIAGASPVRPILYLVFNKRNKAEAEKLFPSYCAVQTFNGCGHRVWSKACAKPLKLLPKKTQDLLREIIDDLPKASCAEVWDAFWDIVAAVARAKALGYVPDGVFPNAKRLISPKAFHASLDERPTPYVATLIDLTLTASIKAAYEGLIDFNDQIYMPALFGGTFPRFPLVLVDEAQDLNPTNHAMLDKLCRNRVVAVGDPWQSIYGFRGAAQSGMQRIKERFACEEATLSISFRCPRRIVENARWRVPAFKWFNEGGTVATCRNMAHSTISDDAAIICRNNAPLFALAFRLLSSGRSVSVAGSNIGPRVVGTMQRLGPETLSRAQTLSAIQQWLAEKTAKGSTTAADMAACMVIFAEHGETLSQACAYAEHLFAQKGRLQLLTGHKAKGLEFDIVYHLDPWLIGDSKQEHNLRYVIQTRSKREYYEVNSKDIRWP
jgi:hypothetical protein